MEEEHLQRPCGEASQDDREISFAAVLMSPWEGEDGEGKFLLLNQTLALNWAILATGTPGSEQA